MSSNTIPSPCKNSEQSSRLKIIDSEWLLEVLRPLLQTRRQARLDIITDVLVSEVDIPYGIGEGDILDENLFIAGHPADKADTCDVREPDVVASFKALIFHEIEQGLALIGEFGFGIVEAYALDEGVGHTLAIDFALHDKVHLLGAVLMGEFGGGMHSDTFLKIAADRIDLDKDFLTLGDSGECQLEVFIADLALNANGILVAADFDLVSSGEYHPHAEYRHGHEETNETGHKR